MSDKSSQCPRALSHSTWVCGACTVYNLGGLSWEKAHKVRFEVCTEAWGWPRSLDWFHGLTVSLTPGLLHDTLSWIWAYYRLLEELVVWRIQSLGAFLLWGSVESMRNDVPVIRGMALRIKGKHFSEQSALNLCKISSNFGYQRVSLTLHREWRTIQSCQLFLYVFPVTLEGSRGDCQAWEQKHFALWGGTFMVVLYIHPALLSQEPHEVNITNPSLQV